MQLYLLHFLRHASAGGNANLTRLVAFLTDHNG
eukprot:COSAG02_NODE_12395_length_1553_cov_4.239340_1_plen_32_part_10